MRGGAVPTGFRKRDCKAKGNPMGAEAKAIMGNLEKIASCDPTIYDAISAALTQNDRRSLLWIQNVVRLADPAYCYLEIGSELGGSLFPHLVDDRCRRVISVDLRVHSQPDERGVRYSYAGV